MLELAASSFQNLSLTPQKCSVASLSPEKEKPTPDITMIDDTYDDIGESYEPFYYEDPISERAMVFHHVARLTDEIKDPEVKNLCMTILRKLMRVFAFQLANYDR